ncbi:MAG: M42 family metallopeptidase [Ruminococcaceae bacterium]|nr:M42 family metallopeptidase [Oscillospiraceae bacterium]
MYLSELTALSGVSGNERAVRNFIKEKAAPYADAVEIDSMGNLLVFQKGTGNSGKTLMLCAHMDEVGLIVSRITEEGFLKFKTVGGIDPRVLVSKRVCVGEVGLSGVIGRKAIHLLSKEERKKAPEIKNLYVDIGAKDKEEAESKVSIGDYITFNSAYVPFGGGLVKAKAVDNRAGCAVLLDVMQEPCSWDRVYAFTVQEETGLRGARLCARRVKPDMALVLEATTCSDLPETDKHMMSTRLGGGAAISFTDGTTSYNRKLVQRLYQLAEENHIPVQYKQTATGGNDAGIIHVSAGGILTAAISVPARYIHSPVSVISLVDYEAVKKLTKVWMQEVSHAELVTDFM